MAQNPVTSQQNGYRTVKDLCQQFQLYEARYLSASYSESQARTDFIDKLFTALGWDVGHHQQLNPFEQEVKVEKNITINARQKRADYAFYLKPNFRDAVFYVEAKRPTLNLATADNYFQTIRYGWNTNTSLAVLTDFREIHVLDCRYRPHIDTCLSMCVLKLSISQLVEEEEFAKLYWLFSREAVADSSIEKRAAELPSRRAIGVQRGLFKGGDQTIDDAFIGDLDRMRDTLARSFKRKNPNLTGNTLTEITQRVLDRLVFMRFLEDKLIETSIKVGDLGKGGLPWAEFRSASSRLDQRYNGVVFKPHRVLDQDQNFLVDDTIFGDICAELDDSRSPYNFDVIPIHILGSIYERFLGKTIVVDGRNAKLEVKPEVRKAGGVYYTPEPVVRYIVAKSIGAKISGKTPTQIGAMKFADIACGSGSFLITIYDELLRYHQIWYNSQANNARFIRNGDCIRADDGVLHLTLSTRRRILLGCVYGVDIDHQAVEVAQLSLYLKLLEEETTATARNYQLEIGGAILPSLASNIACGNSLIEDITTLDDKGDEALARKLNIFEFDRAFPWMARHGGFDAIVGNPPWGAEFDAETISILRATYKTAEDDSIDSYAVFMERARSLLNENGLLAYIVPDTFLRKDGYSDTRAMFFSGRIHELVETGPVFSQVRDTWCLIFVASKNKVPRTSIEHRKLSRFIVSVEDRLKNFSKEKWDVVSRIPQSFWASRPGLVVAYLAEPNLQKLVRKLEIFPRLGELATVFSISRGEEGSKLKIKTDLRGKFVMHIPADVRQYSLGPGVQVTSSGLAPNKVRDFYEHPKIWITRIQKMRWQQRLVCAYDDSTSSAAMKTLQLIVSVNDDKIQLKALTAVLSSRIVNLWCINYLADDLNQTYLEKIPMPLRKAQKAEVVALANLVDKKMKAVKSAAEADSDSDINYFERLALSAGHDIEKSVARMYGLSTADLELIEAFEDSEVELKKAANRLRNGLEELDESVEGI